LVSALVEAAGRGAEVVAVSAVSLATWSVAATWS